MQRVSEPIVPSTIETTTVTGAIGAATKPTGRPEWRAIVARYQDSDVRHSVFQLVTTLVPLAVAMVVMYRSLAFPYWVTFLLSVPTAGLLVRTFILMHDCAHGSFLPSRRANDLVGWVTGVLTLTPFGAWRRDHALHHASSGDLDRRGHGDIDTLTVKEYLARPPIGRLKYRLFRNPLVMFGLGPIQFILNNRRQPSGGSSADRKDSSVASTNLAILLAVVAASLWIGPRAVFLIYFPPMYMAAAAGIWMFYVQHQFESTYWKDHADWDYATAAIRGSSYFKLPPVLRWFTGSIGLHHVHHLGPRIPNYKLGRCHEENPLFHDATVLTLRESVRTIGLTLWDEDRQRLVRFRDARTSRVA